MKGERFHTVFYLTILMRLDLAAADEVLASVGGVVKAATLILQGFPAAGGRRTRDRRAPRPDPVLSGSIGYLK